MESSLPPHVSKSNWWWGTEEWGVVAFLTTLRLSLALYYYAYTPAINAQKWIEIDWYDTQDAYIAFSSWPSNSTNQVNKRQRKISDISLLYRLDLSPSMWILINPRLQSKIEIIFGKHNLDTLISRYRVKNTLNIIVMCYEN